MKTTAIIPRPLYMNRLRPYYRSGLIKVLTGQRRVGKSYILRAVEEELRETDPAGNFIHIDLEDFAFSRITTAESLYSEIHPRLSETVRNYIFIDEIQEVEGFERVVRSLNLDSKNDLYVTGSNSAMLSSEIASRLAGRSVEIKVHPLTYGEFCIFHGFADSDDSLEKYLRFGGMPYLRNLPDVGSWGEYLSGLADTMVYRDIVARHPIRNIDFLQRMLIYMADNIGRLFTAKRIADYIKSQRISGSVASVQTYADYICEAFVANKVRRWDLEGKRFFEIGEKYYFEDLGIRNSIIGLRPDDMGAILENAVYNTLSCAGYVIKIGVLSQGKEVDFIAEKDGETLYVQASLVIDSDSTAEREFGNLVNIPDNYRKIVVTLRDSSPNTHRGIEMMSLRDFFNNVMGKY